MNELNVFRAFLRRDWLVARSYRVGFAFQFFGIASELFLYYFIGKLVDDGSGTSQYFGDAGFFAFVVIGRSLLSIVTHALVTVSQSVQREQGTGSLEAILMTPQRPTLVLVASSAFSTVTVFIVQVLTILTAIVFFGLRLDLSLSGAIVAMLTVISCVTFFLSLGLGVAGGTLVAKRGITSLASYAMSGAALICGIYYPVEILPEPIGWLASMFPLTWGVDLLRDAVFGEPTNVWKLLMLVVVSVAAVPAGLFAFRRGLLQAKHEGTLAHF